MKSCASCEFCANTINDRYICLMKQRDVIKDLFVLGRVRCTKYKEIELVLGSV